MKSTKLTQRKAAMHWAAVITMVLLPFCSLLKAQSIKKPTFFLETSNKNFKHALNESSTTSGIMIRKNKLQQVKQMVYGEPIKTRSYHNSECINCNGDPYPHTCIDNWCFKIYELSVSAPQGWYFTGEPQLNCVEDNEGAFGWNYGYTNRKVILQRDPKFIKIRYFIGSRSILVNLKCEATKE